MLGRDELIRALVELDPKTLEEVINSAYRSRSESTAEVALADHDPHATIDQFARWIAQRHLDSDTAIDRVVYLPAGAPENEIRLLEVNRFLSDEVNTDIIEPLDFTPEMDLPYRVFVADITSDQWDRILANPNSTLPPGWQSPNYQMILRA